MLFPYDHLVAGIALLLVGCGGNESEQRKEKELFADSYRMSRIQNRPQEDPLQEEEELEVEIVVPALLAPLPKAGLISQLRKSPRLAVVEEAHDDFGVGAEVLASLMEAGYGGRAIRIGTPPVPISSARSLESRILPSRDRLIHEILDLFE